MFVPLTGYDNMPFCDRTRACPGFLDRIRACPGFLDSPRWIPRDAGDPDILMLMRKLDAAPHPLLLVGQIEAQVSHMESSPALIELLTASWTAPAPFDQGSDVLGEIHQVIRRLLRNSGYKPSGRGKPASEYLVSSASKFGSVRSISALVDVNNAVSLHTGLPMSLFDAGRLGDDLLVRPGTTGESYVFNPSGQEIKLDGLITLYHLADGAWCPAGNAVKDSMGTKVSEGTGRVIGIVYASTELAPGYLEETLRWYGALLTEFCGATELESRIVEAPR